MPERIRSTIVLFNDLRAVMMRVLRDELEFVVVLRMTVVMWQSRTERQSQRQQERARHLGRTPTRSHGVMMPVRSLYVNQGPVHRSSQRLCLCIISTSSSYIASASDSLFLIADAAQCFR